MSTVTTHRPGKRMVDEEQLLAGIDAYLDYMRRLAQETLNFVLVDYEPVPIDVQSEIGGGEIEIGPFFVEYIQLPTGGPFIYHQDGVVILTSSRTDRRKTYIGATWHFSHGSRINTFHDVEASSEDVYSDLRKVVEVFEAQHKRRR